ncbi:THAP domain-containing protein 1-like [Diadema setosum]|uniref:THAP domain-containing protein 1-like n=1 Tax=Diadema setosum TaxID=31175 RepID=UPI003B3A9F09
MGGGDRCAVYGCKNDRRYPERYVVKDHVYILKFHKCTNPRHYAKWTRLLNRDKFRVTSSTRVCSNHFRYGQPFPDDNHPTLYLKGYDVQPKTPSRPPPKLRLPLEPKERREDGKPKSVGVQVSPGDFDNLHVGDEHNYAFSSTPCIRFFSQDYVDNMDMQLQDATSRCEALQQTVSDLTAKVSTLEKMLIATQRFGVADISSDIC